MRREDNMGLTIRLAPRPTKRPMQGVSGQSCWGVKLAAHLYLVPKLSMRGTIPSLPHVSSWLGLQVQEYFYSFRVTACKIVAYI
jgi:hypothetical protein